ncbi:hypothetical protein EVAR_19354_1 [Eumeta japonica]|uniref:Uncharacterized protein n=1 Tax=Eumeta variegata TaxID=151549 RepID=A0A4C1TRP2_EUMVA|nr:hypothetical protein EVAR_19354_1 [Eumeta japonica]
MSLNSSRIKALASCLEEKRVKPTSAEASNDDASLAAGADVYCVSRKITTAAEESSKNTIFSFDKGIGGVNLAFVRGAFSRASPSAPLVTARLGGEVIALCS